MQAEKVVRYGGLALVLLFPLLSVLQLRDTERPWREAARRVRPSVVALHRASESNVPGQSNGPEQMLGCGVVIHGSPPRLLVAGRVAGPLCSRYTGGWLEWRLLHQDDRGEFTILQANEPLESGAGSPWKARRLPPARLLQDDGDHPEDIEVALVGPAEHPASLWVGLLTATASEAGRRGYVSSYLEPIGNSTYTSEAFAASPPEIQPTLRGAPFVDARGRVVAIYLGRGEARLRALPIEIVTQALAILDLQAAK